MVTLPSHSFLTHPVQPYRLAAFQRLKHLFSVLLWLDAAEGLDDHTLLVDQIGGSDQAFCGLSILARLQHIIRRYDFQCLICQQWERQPVFLLKPFVGFHAVLTHTKYHRAFSLICG